MFFSLTRFGLLASAALAGCHSQSEAATPSAALVAASIEPATPATTRYAGEYRWREAEKDDMGGTLTVYPESDSTILFQVEANDGAPAYHLANAFGRAHLRGDTATYFSKAPEDEHGCRLKIGFSPTAARVILVSSAESDCFFGGNFTPDGTYRRTSRAVPQQVVSDGNDTLHFAHLPPNALKDSH
ncbi:MAG: hypothetical protein ACRYFX_22250 [Janthinobacterium lividum]